MINEGDDILDQIQKMYGEIPKNFNILEEKIDVDLQLKYFDQSRKINKKKINAEEVMASVSSLYEDDVSDKDKMDLLQRLATIPKVEVYRALERFCAEGAKNLKDWGLLAFQESKMLMKTSLLDENQIFISTGLGGKGSKLRYFIVLQNQEERAFSPTEEKVIKGEFEFAFKKQDAEIEEVKFSGQVCTIMTLIPINAGLKEIFRSTIEECNQYGNFLKDSFIITNVKVFSKEEIAEYIASRKK